MDGWWQRRTSDVLALVSDPRLINNAACLNTVNVRPRGHQTVDGRGLSMNHWIRVRSPGLGIAQLAIVLLLMTGPAVAQQDSHDFSWNDFADNQYYKIYLNMRYRIELGDADGLERSEAYTLRTRFGIGSKPLAGFSGYVELENIVSMCSSCYFDKVQSPTGQTNIADPELTQLNRAFIRYENKGDRPFIMLVGRQRIIFDDQRFIGNIPWRQNEQTFDSAYGESGFGFEGLKVRYGYIWDVKRIFGDKGNNPALGDFDSDSHLVNISYQTSLPTMPRIAIFGYLLDFDNNSPSSAIASSNSYGFRANGRYEFDEGWSLDYVLSYAYQTDAGDNPINYDAHYVWASLEASYDPLGSLGLGYEMLGSDGNNARFVTPVSTAHKFSGFADVWLDNGGVGGLEDLFVSLAPKLPWDLKGKLSYHRFWSEFSSADLGSEIDGVLGKKLGYGFSVFSKGAYYDSTGPSRDLGRSDTWRWSIQLDYDF